MRPASKLVKACAQLAWLAETLTDAWPEEPERRRLHLKAMRERLGEIEALCPEAMGPEAVEVVIDPSGTDPWPMDPARSPGGTSAQPTGGTDPAWVGVLR